MCILTYNVLLIVTLLLLCALVSCAYGGANGLPAAELSGGKPAVGSGPAAEEEPQAGADAAVGEEPEAGSDAAVGAGADIILPVSQNPGENTAGAIKRIYLAGGCFWGVEKYLSLIPGVVGTEVGYANGRTENPSYEDVVFRDTGHAETVLVEYDPAKIELAYLLELFYEAIDPTTLNRQGNDIGTQYRTGIYYVDEADRDIIEASVSGLGERTEAPVVIETAPLENYYTAEEYHQKYLEKNPSGYCHIGAEEFEKLLETVGTESSGAGAGEAPAYIPTDYGYGQITEFTAEDINGAIVTETIFAEKPVTFVNYWATWCGPCRSELPDFPGMYEKYKDDVQFITIIDDGKNNANATSLAEKYLDGYVNLLPSANLVKPIETGYIPTTVIVDAGGYLITEKIIGAVGDYGKYIDEALATVNN